MPELQLDDDDQWESLRAFMLFPTDEVVRTGYLAARRAHRFRSRQNPKAPREMPKIFRDAEFAAARDGILAGWLASSIYLFKAFPNLFPQPSMRRAYYLLANRAKSGSVYGDGARITSREATLRDKCVPFLPVAHLWGAIELHKLWPSRPKHELLTDEGAVTLLGIAKTIQDTCYSFVAAGDSERKDFSRVYSEDLLWTVPTRFQALRPPAVEGDQRLAEMAELYLTYKSPYISKNEVSATVETVALRPRT
jgi:hypothetical protein